MRWSLETINWGAFDASQVDPHMLRAVKAAALVEFNAPDYVEYLCNVFADDPDVQDGIREWGREESQHGRALAAWARRADPSFPFEEASARFCKLQRINKEVRQSIRGSKAGEMITRYVVECGTSSFYSAIRDRTKEPCLKQIVTNMAADEFSHYGFFYRTFQKFEHELPGRLGRLSVALGRVLETQDDELAGAYYCANCPPSVPFERAKYARAYSRVALSIYERRHVDRLVAMVAKAGGLKPHGMAVSAVQRLAWQYFRHQGRALAN